MTNKDTPTAEQLVHKHLENYEVVPRFSETRIHKIHNLYTDFPVIAESYLSLLDQLKIAKEALEECGEFRKQINPFHEIDDETLDKLTKISDIVDVAISKLTI